MIPMPILAFRFHVKFPGLPINHQDALGQHLNNVACNHVSRQVLITWRESKTLPVMQALQYLLSRQMDSFSINILGPKIDDHPSARLEFQFPRWTNHEVKFDYADDQPLNHHLTVDYSHVKIIDLVTSQPI